MELAFNMTKESRDFQTQNTSIQSGNSFAKPKVPKKVTKNVKREDLECNDDDGIEIETISSKKLSSHFEGSNRFLFTIDL